MLEKIEKLRSDLKIHHFCIDKQDQYVVDDLLEFFNKASETIERAKRSIEGMIDEEYGDEELTQFEKQLLVEITTKFG